VLNDHDIPCFLGSPARRPDRPGPVRLATRAPPTTRPQLRTGNLDDVRVSCTGPALMQALPEARKAEPAAAGVRHTPGMRDKKFTAVAAYCNTADCFPDHCDEQ